MLSVSIVINCLNAERHLRETLDSVFAQTFDDWEVILWDNASKDATGEIAKSYGEKVRYFRSDTTTDLSIARNRGFEKTQSKYVAILDSDDIWLPQKLERQVALFEADEQVGLTFCDCACFDSSGDHYRLFQVNKPHRGRAFGNLLAENFIFSSAMMFRRSALDRLGYVFDETYARVQDYELTLRVAYNYPIDYVDEPLCRWRMYQDSPEWRAWKNSLVPRARERKAAIDRLLEMYPDIQASYSAELELLNKEMDYQLGVTAWQLGNPWEARSYLSKNLVDKKSAVVFLCTFLMSNAFFNRLKGIYKTVVPAFIRTWVFGV